MSINADRLRSIRDKKKERIDKLRQEIDLLSKKILEAENMEIIATIRSLSVTPEELASLLHELRGLNKDPDTQAEKEDDDYEENT